MPNDNHKTTGVSGGVSTSPDIIWLLLAGGAGYLYLKSRQNVQAAVAQATSTGSSTGSSTGTFLTSTTGAGATATTTPTVPYTPAPPSQASASLAYDASAAAPSVSLLKLASYNASTQTAVLTWTGAQATWIDPNGNLADNTGYNLYQIVNGTPQLMATEVEPPLYVPGVVSGTVLGIAPTYLTHGGREITGQIVTVTVS